MCTLFKYVFLSLYTFYVYWLHFNHKSVLFSEQYCYFNFIKIHVFAYFICLLTFFIIYKQIIAMQACLEHLHWMLHNNKPRISASFLSGTVYSHLCVACVFRLHEQTIKTVASVTTSPPHTFIAQYTDQMIFLSVFCVHYNWFLE